ncbi:MAG TPA: HEAT repeat domain-containing protein [Bryobacteraceae bacterium]|nr:HEAT repeat domain-containing protein [Bryobacteraceae bacterium]
MLATEQSVSEKAWTILEAGLHDEKSDKRAQAVFALGLVPRDNKAIETAEHALNDPDPNVRRAAIDALGEMNSKRSLPKIKALISNSDGRTVLAIAAVLTKFKDPEGYEIYYEVLTGKRKDGGSILAGIKDRKALEKMGVETAIGFAPFGGVATGAYGYLKQNSSSHANTDVTAASALAGDRDPVAEKALVDTSFDGKEAVQIAALRALATRGDPSVVKDIEPAMYSDKPSISYTAAATVVHLLDIRPKQRA